MLFALFVVVAASHLIGALADHSPTAKVVAWLKEDQGLRVTGCSVKNQGRLEYEVASADGVTPMFRDSTPKPVWYCVVRVQNVYGKLQPSTTACVVDAPDPLHSGDSLRILRRGDHLHAAEPCNYSLG